jgi:hypothetical protein
VTAVDSCPKWIRIFSIFVIMLGKMSPLLNNCAHSFHCPFCILRQLNRSNSVSTHLFEALVFISNDPKFNGISDLVQTTRIDSPTHFGFSCYESARRKWLLKMVSEECIALSFRVKARNMCLKLFFRKGYSIYDTSLYFVGGGFGAPPTPTSTTSVAEAQKSTWSTFPYSVLQGSYQCTGPETFRFLASPGPDSPVVKFVFESNKIGSFTFHVEFTSGLKMTSQMYSRMLPQPNGPNQCVPCLG